MKLQKPLIFKMDDLFFTRRDSVDAPMEAMGEKFSLNQPWSLHV